MRYNTHNNSRAEQIFKELTCHDSVEISRNCLKRLMLEMREWRAPHHILFTTHTHAVLLRFKKGAILMNLYYTYFLKH